jgi:hypothetical protein
MYEISRLSRTIWLRTNRAVVPTKTADWRHLLAVQDALQQGLFAIQDLKRPEFFEMEIEDSWYYIHIPSRIAGVYLIAAGRTRREKTHVRHHALMMCSIDLLETAETLQCVRY